MSGTVPQHFEESGVIRAAAKATRRTWPCTLAAVFGLPLLLLLAPLISSSLAAGAAGAENKGPLSIALQVGAPGTAANSMSIAAAGMRPGDVDERSLDVLLAGRVAARVTLSVRVTKSSLLDQRRADGLQLTIEACSKPWIEAPRLHYSCPGTRTTILGARPLVDAKRGASVTVVSAAESATVHLRARLTLPASAGNALQGRSSTLRLDLSALPAHGH